VTRRRPIFLQLRFSSLLIAMVVLAISVPHLSAQAASGTLDCLEIHSSQERGRFDLTRGVYIDLTAEQAPNSVRSPDGMHVSYIDNETQQIIIASNTGKPEHSFKLPPSASSGYRPEWSPDSRFVAHRMTLDEGKTDLIILSVDGNVEQQFIIASLGVDAPPVLLWSPDSRYIAAAVDAHSLEKSAVSETAINLYGVDGSVLPHVVEDAVGFLTCGEVCDQHSSFEWSGDGRSLLYVQFAPRSGRQLDLADTQFDVMAYRLDEQQNFTLARNVSDFPVYRFDHKFALIQWRSADVTNAGVLDVQKANTLTLDSRSSRVDLKWLGNTPLVRWDTTLVWAKVDGTGKHLVDVSPSRLVNGPTTVAFDETAAYDWSLDGRWMVMMTIADSPDSDTERHDIWVIDLITGKTRTFPNLSVVYTVDGRFLSPDGRIAVLVGDGVYMLYLAGGKPIKVRLDPSLPFYELHQFVWSPDMTMFALVFSYEGTGLYLVRRDGTIFRHYEQFMPWSSDPPLWRVSWSDCH
jgi:hypothetical protein